MHTLTIAHRVCPVLSKTAIGFPDKFSMVKAAATSMQKAIEFANVKTKLIVILDGCPSEYETLFIDLFHESVYLEIIKTPSILNRATYGKQIEILLKEDAEYVYFSEDDYIYRKEAFAALLDALKTRKVDFATPLDHPGYYRTKTKSDKYDANIYITRYGHWRPIHSTCLTFMTSSKVLRETAKVLRYFADVGEECGMWLTLTKYGVFNIFKLLRAACLYTLKRNTALSDYCAMLPLIAWKHSKFRVLSMRKYSLWHPVPSLAVHCSTESLPLLSEKILEDSNCEVSDNIIKAEHEYLNLAHS